MTNISNPAGFWIRLVADIIDALVIGIPLGIVGFLIGGNNPEQGLGGSFFINLLGLLYYILLPVFWDGYTVGKKVFGIRIAKVNGEKLGIGSMIMREVIANIIYGITLGIAVIVSAFMVGLRKDKRAIHDFLAGTYVTYDRP